MASAEFQSIFARLRAILQKHAGRFSVTNEPERYCLAGNVGPAALAARKGKMKRPIMPVAWVSIGKAYVSYHLMGIYANQNLQKTMSKELKARMQGKTCFNFKNSNEALFRELEQVTATSIEDFRKAGFIPS
jgi:hypothetical protein